MTEHSPGPWRFDRDWNRIPTIFDANGVMVASVEKSRVVGRLSVPLPEREGNALLIEAAPDLLAAAQLLEIAEHSRQDCDECEGEGEPEACGKCFPAFDDARIRRRNAIAKFDPKFFSDPPVSAGKRE